MGIIEVIIGRFWGGEWNIDNDSIYAIHLVHISVNNVRLILGNKLKYPPLLDTRVPFIYLMRNAIYVWFKKTFSDFILSFSLIII